MRSPLLSRTLAAAALVAALALIGASAPAGAFEAAEECPCWGAGGPYNVPGFCSAAAPTRFAYSTSGPTFAQHVVLGALSYCRNNALFRWTTPAEHYACEHSLHLACSDILAVAYTDRNHSDHFDRGDDLIAKLVDADGSGDPGLGDVTVADVFPLETGSGGPTGSFGVKAVACTNVFALSSSVSCVNEGGTTFRWEVLPTVRESFAEMSGAGNEVWIDDLFSSANADSIFVRADLFTVLDPSPAPVNEFSADTGDQDFIDVDIFVESPGPT